MDCSINLNYVKFVLMWFGLLYPCLFAVYFFSQFIERDALKSLTKTVVLLFFQAVVSIFAALIMKCYYLIDKPLGELYPLNDLLSL